MRFLALETSTLSGSVALLRDNQVLLQAALPGRPRVAQTLVPAVEGLLRHSGWPVADLQMIAVTVGPGSFTGLRVGVTTAKTLAYALQTPILGVDTLEVIAWQAFAGIPPAVRNEAPPRQPASSPPAADSPAAANSPAAEALPASALSAGGMSAGATAPAPLVPNDAILHVVLDAQRGDLFQATFSSTPAGRLVRQTSTRVVSGESWRRQLAPGVWTTGGGLRSHRQDLPAGVSLVDPRLWSPQAAVVGMLAHRDFLDGRRDDLWTLVPNYYRPSAAEEKASQGESPEKGS